MIDICMFVVMQRAGEYQQTDPLMGYCCQRYVLNIFLDEMVGPPGINLDISKLFGQG